MAADEDAIEHFEERSAVLEYMAGKHRAVAESLALKEVVVRYGVEAGRAVQRYREGKK